MKEYGGEMDELRNKAEKLQEDRDFYRQRRDSILLDAYAKQDTIDKAKNALQRIVHVIVQIDHGDEIDRLSAIEDIIIDVMEDIEQ